MRCDIRVRDAWLAALLLLFVVSALAQVPAAPQGPARDLPTPVLTAFQKSYPGATINNVSTERDGNSLAFRVDATDRGLRRVILYSITGSVIESSEQVSEKDLPKPVLDAMHSQKKAQFVKGMKLTRSVNTYYELTLRGTRKTTMTVKPDGTVLEFK
jgi:hypothetical protein